MGGGVGVLGGYYNMMQRRTLETVGGGLEAENEAPLFQGDKHQGGGISGCHLKCTLLLINIRWRYAATAVSLTPKCNAYVFL